MYSAIRCMRGTWKVDVVGVPAGKKQVNCETKETRWGHLLFETRTHAWPRGTIIIIIIIIVVVQTHNTITSGHRKNVSDLWNWKRTDRRIITYFNAMYNINYCRVDKSRDVRTMTAAASSRARAQIVRRASDTIILFISDRLAIRIQGALVVLLLQLGYYCFDGIII